MRLTNLIKATICPLAQNRRKYDFCKISLFILKPYYNSHVLTRYISVLSGKKKKKKSSATLFSYQLLGKLIQLWACIAWLDSRAERAGFVFAFGTSGSMICTSNFSQISKAWDCWYFIRTQSQCTSCTLVLAEGSLCEEMEQKWSFTSSSYLLLSW